MLDSRPDLAVQAEQGDEIVPIDPLKKGDDEDPSDVILQIAQLVYPQLVQQG
jgi:hypothetical protein